MKVTKLKLFSVNQSIIKNIFEIDMNYLLHGNFAHENIRKKLLLIGERTKVEKLRACFKSPIAQKISIYSVCFCLKYDGFCQIRFLKFK